MSDNSNFFNFQTLSSKIKATIVSEYFPQYCKIIARKHMPERFGYFDMFAGPGIYEDGQLSTPILVAQKCVSDNILKDKVWMIFNDMTFGMKLKENFLSYFPNGTFGIKPFFANRIFGETPKIDTFLTRNTIKNFYNECPTLLFIDPWGYKHINTKVLSQFLNYWGNEIFIFINTKRLNADFEKEVSQANLMNVFPITYETIKKEKKLQGSVEERHKFIVDNLGKEFKAVLNSNVYYTAFEFREENQGAPSHYLLHLTKGAKGYELIKQVYDRYANTHRTLTGYVTYTFDPKKTPISDFVDEFFKQENIETLKKQLMETFAKRSIPAYLLFKEHQKNCLYAERHYRLALRQLVDEKKISVSYVDDKKHKVSVLIIPECIITFK